MGCRTAKRNDIKKTNTTTQTLKREGDTLKYEVPFPIYKDTTIYVKNFEKAHSNTLRITYDEQGKQAIECISDKIDEVKTQIMEEIDNSVERQSKFEFKDIYILYLFLGLAFLIVVSRLLNKVT